MKITKAREWLDRLLSGAQPGEDDLKQLVRDCPQEDQHIDYKSGQLDPQKAPEVMREYVAAFGNSDGGVVVIGYDHKVTRFDGIKAPGQSTLVEWATRSLYDLAAYLSPQPRIIVSNIQGVEVLVIATARAPRLVPVVLKGQLVFFIRIGESNYPAPPFLLSDLVLGRRNHPILKLTLEDAKLGERFDLGLPNIRGVSVGLKVSLENVSLMTAREVRCGLLTWSTPKNPADEETSIAESLLANVDLQLCPIYRTQQAQPEWKLIHLRLGPAIDVGALDKTSTHSFRFFATPMFPHILGIGPPALKPNELGYADRQEVRLQMYGGIELKAAMYVLARDAEPWWWQLTLRYDFRHGLTHFSLDPVTTPRPMVSIDFHLPPDETI